MTVATHDRRIRVPGWRARAQLEEARAEAIESAQRLVRTHTLTEQAVSLAGRLQTHRQENHFAARLESLFKESR